MPAEPIFPRAEVCARLAAQALPRWRELPDLDLYMDQVLALVGRYLSACPGFDDRPLTASMVNNYVKLGVMPPPRKKRYTRTHLAHLLVICVLKSVLPIAAIERLLGDTMRGDGAEAFYDGFCALFERAGAEAAAQSDPPAEAAGGAAAVCRAALRAQAEQTLSLQLCAALYPQK